MNVGQLVQQLEADLAVLKALDQNAEINSGCIDMGGYTDPSALAHLSIIAEYFPEQNVVDITVLYKEDAE